jgi:hypothetical protein
MTVMQPGTPDYVASLATDHFSATGSTVTLLDEFFQTCGSLFIQRVDAVANLSVFSTPICLTNGATVAVQAKGKDTLAFIVNTNDLGLASLIVPGFDVKFAGVGVPGTQGGPDTIVWTASAHMPTPGRLSNFQLANGNSLAFEIERVSGSVTTMLSEITPPAFVDDANGQAGKGAIRLEGPAAAEALEIVTSYGRVSVSMNRIQLVAVAQLPQVARAPAKPVTAAAKSPLPPAEQVPMFTIKLKPCAQGNVGDFRIEGIAVPFNMNLVGGEEAWNCRVQLEGTPGLVSVTLIVTNADTTKP